MSLLRKLRRAAMFSLIAAGMAVGTQQAASACDTVTTVRVKPVVTYVVKQVPYTTWTIRYDECGHPYKVARTAYRTVRIPVERLVTIVN